MKTSPVAAGGARCQQIALWCLCVAAAAIVVRGAVWVLSGRPALLDGYGHPAGEVLAHNWGVYGVVTAAAYLGGVIASAIVCVLEKNWRWGPFALVCSLVSVAGMVRSEANSAMGPVEMVIIVVAIGALALFFTRVWPRIEAWGARPPK